MGLWHEAMDDLVPLEEGGDLTIDQRLKALEVKALLSISQELSKIRDHANQQHAGYAADQAAPGDDNPSAPVTG